MYSICRDLAIILVAAKLFGILARKLKAPMVVGEIIAGLIIGPVLGLVHIQGGDFLSGMAEIGVLILMFSAGLGTDLKELLKTGPIAILIAICGVFIPLIGGTLYYQIFYGFVPFGSEEFLRAVFIGTILTATSVSITVEALRELGYLKGRVGTTILNAAIIDDIIGIVVLTVVIGLKSGDTSYGKIILKTVLFFVFAFAVGFVVYKLFKLIDKKYAHTRRIPILGLALCFALAYVSEKFFGIADITGAYAAGIMLCSLQDSSYIANKMDINAYMIFAPIFFVSIGLKTDISGLTGSIVLFSIGFVIIGLLTKIIGCALISRACKFSWPDSLKIGIGMMTRGEVALIVAQKGFNVGLLDSVYFSSVILLIIVSSILTPILLKILFSKFHEKTKGSPHSDQPTTDQPTTDQHVAVQPTIIEEKK